MVGEAGDDLLRGGTGRDILLGETGNDRLIGGVGADLLDGGAGADHYRYEKKVEFGDRIKFFDDSDKIEVGRSIFPVKAVPLDKGVLKAKFLHIGTDNQAIDGNDYFIYRTTDNTLWIDLDGRKSVHHAVLLADFDNNAVFTASDILIV
jgi:Ca2+-binding RTX toxin-like protein